MPESETPPPVNPPLTVPVPGPPPPANVPSEEIRFRVVLNAKADRVYKALITPEDLSKWFCRSAEVEAKEGGLYAPSWGEGRTAQWSIQTLAPGRSLVVLLPEPVSFTLTEEADGRTCLELLVQTALDAMPPVKEQVLWAVHLLYLKGYLDHGIDLREKDQARSWRDGYVNGSEA